MLKIVVILTFALATGFGLFQNCSDVVLERRLSVQNVEGAGELAGLSYLNTFTPKASVYRAAFVVDVSQSMYSGPCSGSVDTMIPGVTASENCAGPTGVDPEGKRWKVILSWLNEIEERVLSGELNGQQFAFKVIPYSSARSGLRGRGNPWSIALANSVGDSLGMNFGDGFLSISDSQNLVLIFWALETFYNQAVFDQNSNPVSNPNAVLFDPMIPEEIRQVVINRRNLFRGLTNPNQEDAIRVPSSGLSIPAVGIGELNQSIHAELSQLKDRGILEDTSFEIVFLSDGVPKPHPLHIEALAHMIWNSKRNVCDLTYVIGSASHCANSGRPYVSRGAGTTIDAVFEVQRGDLCSSRCQGYLRTYIETGVIQVPDIERPRCLGGPFCSQTIRCCDRWSDGSTRRERWATGIKCGQCFDLLLQYKNEVPQFSRDPLRDDILAYWGDWTDNRHTNIIRLLNTTQNIFEVQHPGADWKFNFLLVDSETEQFKIQPGELNSDINWIKKSEEHFKHRHRFEIVRSPQPNFDLFPQISRRQNYVIGSIYVYNRNFRIDFDGQFKVDSDGDGLFDAQEIKLGFDPLKPRTDGECLDSIRFRYGDCIRLGCDPEIDRDGDGLNQCEEKTLGSSDFQADSDGDGIIDSTELLFGLNPLMDDRHQDSNNNGITNFEQFLAGVHPMVNYRSIANEHKIKVSTKVEDLKRVDIDDRHILVTGYKIAIRDIPIGRTLDAPEGEPAKNEIVLIVRVDSTTQAFNSLFLHKVFTLEVGASLEIDLGDLVPLTMGAP